MVLSAGWSEGEDRAWDVSTGSDGMTIMETEQEQTRR